MTIKVAVVGAGIIGMTTAVRTLETVAHVSVTVIAEHFTPHTTGDVAAGFFKPYSVSGVSDEKLRDWCIESYNFYNQLLHSEDAPRLGLAEMPAYHLEESWNPRPKYADAFPLWRDLTEKELEAFPSKYKYGSYLISMIIECKRFLPYLMQRFQKRGGRFLERRLENLEELGLEYDVVMNCTGLGASRICPDTKVHPVRGQTIRVQAPWIKHIVIGGTDFHVIPNIDDVMLGGTIGVGEYSLIPDSETGKKIWKGCCELVPSLKHANIIGDFVGLRPGRDPLRIERENRIVQDGSKTFPIVHNYGHGGSGVTLAWGCAGEAVRLLEDVIRDNISGQKTLARL
uniref:Putative d-aspartate oxidase n=1 Tax=Ixodes scapularis TaxID=6945 RepID=A0A4D5RR43_IXOSC